MPNSKPLIETLSLAPIEKHALLASKAARRKVFACYLAMREKISEDFLPLVSSAVPFINDHSRGHLERVLAHIENILNRNFTKPASQAEDIPEGRLLTWPDTLIILNALAWHDIGNIYGREGHAPKIHECFKKISGILYDEHLAQYIKQVAQAHSGENAIEKVIPSAQAIASYEGEDVHLQFLASVLRFADELDEDHRRCTARWQELTVIPDPAKRFWYFCHANSSIQVKSVAGDHNLTHEVHVNSHIPEEDFQLTFAVSKRQKVRALSEYFRRIFKLEKERAYCNTYLRTAYYHPGIARIKVRLRTHAENSPPASAPTYEFELSDSSTPDSILDLNRKLKKYVEEALENR